jgi:RHS repeat-associated protein
LGAAGNRLSVTEANGRKATYTYDDLYRLTSETITGDLSPTLNGVVAYSYDPVGNRQSRTSTVAGVPSVASQQYDVNDRLTTDSYDANGNTVASSGNGYVYDFENRLLKVNAGTPQEISITYDGEGNRASKTVGGVTTKFLVDTNNPTGYAQVVEELSVVGSQLSVIRQYTYGNDLISQRQLIAGNWQTSWYQYDGHGSVRSLTNSAGSVTDTFTYDAFGVLIARTGTTPNLYLYAGEQYDPDLMLYYNRARYLKAETGRFWTMDSYEGDLNEPLSLHKYLYANDSPIDNIDPSGQFTVGQIAIGIGILATLATISYLAYDYRRWANSTITIGFEWKNEFFLNSADDLLTKTEVDIVKDSAVNSMREAYAGFKVAISKEGGGTRKIVVSPQLDEAGKTFFNSYVSTVYYPTLLFMLKRYAKERGVSERLEMLTALGRSIGRVAAHEMGHQGGLNFVLDNSKDQNSYDYKSSDRPQLFFGNLYWSDQASKAMQRVIPK